jgi:hypothetical protein
MGEKRNIYRLLLRNPKGNEQLGSSKRKWENNIKMNLREIG